MKNVFRISYFSESSIIRFIKIVFGVVLLFEIGLLRMQAQTVTDIDGNVYKTVAIGTQVWIAENLKTTKYSNDDLIETTIPSTYDISGESTPKYQWAYDGDESNVATYGRLYTWFAITDSRNVCPIGWHVPSDAEWTILADYLTNNGYGYGGSGSDIAKSMATTSGWTTYTTAGTVGNDQASNNSSGFSALPGGSRSNNGAFVNIGDNGLLWSSTETLATYAFYRYIIYVNSDVFGNYCDKSTGLSVRCLKGDISTDITNPSASIMEIYPNPVSGILTIEYKSEDFETVSILNSQGALMTKEKAIAPRQQLDFSKYASGLYFLEFVKTIGEVKRVKVIHN